MVEPKQPIYLRTSEVAELLLVSPKTVTRWARDGKLPFVRTLGNHRRYPAEVIWEIAVRLQAGEGPEGELSWPS